MGRFQFCASSENTTTVYSLIGEPFGLVTVPLISVCFEVATISSPLTS